MRLQTDGKFFLRNGKRLSINAVTYGPFPEPQPVHSTEMAEIVKAGFNAIRLYEPPSQDLLDAALEHGLMVFGGVHWQWYRVFRGVGDDRYFTEGKMRIAEVLEKWAGHEAMVGFFVANEIPSDIARWIGAQETKLAIEEMIDFARSIAPWLLIAYANYPSSEYLEPKNADFTAFNIYLEEREIFTNYLPRLHHLAGDRPVMLTEYGLDTQRNSEEQQANLLEWTRQESLDAGMAGTTVFAWSDRWRIGEREETDWDFGITRRDGSAKESLTVSNNFTKSPCPQPRISVIICVYDGAERIWRAVESLIDVNYPDYELIVVDDGSSDGTQDVVQKYADEYEHIRLIRAEHGGLSNARNVGAENASGEIFAYTDDDCEVDNDWLYWIARGYAEQGCDACGGPNIPPTPEDEDEAVVAAAPGAPSHVMLSDKEAEHIPGCNLTVSRKAFEAIGGFRVQYKVAGDDVDFCWRLEAAGFKIGFHGAAFVWHRRRTSFVRYFKQQKGYGKAEALLMKDHPEKFTRGNGAKWKGCVYTGAAMGASDGSFVYHGAMGSGAYQQVQTHMMPLRDIHPNFRTKSALRKLKIAQKLHPKIRRWARWYYSRKWVDKIEKSPKTEKIKPEIFSDKVEEYSYDIGRDEVPHARADLLEKLKSQGWQESHGYSEWDLTKQPNRKNQPTSRILVITEILGKDHWRIRVRVNGDEAKNMIDSIIVLLKK